MSNIPPDFEDIEGQKRVRAIYMNSIATAIANNCQSQIVPIKKPIDSVAERIAQEIVTQFISSHGMENACNILEAESENNIRVRHDNAWLGRRLRLDDSMPIVPQLVEEICPQNHTTTVESETEKRPHLHVRVKKDSQGNIIENPHEVLNRPDAIKRISRSDLPQERALTTNDVDPLSVSQESRHSHHSRKGHHHHRHHREGYGRGLTKYYEEQENIFTQLEPEIPEAHIADAHYGLPKDKASQIATPQRVSSRYVPSAASSVASSKYSQRRKDSSSEYNPIQIISNLPPPSPSGPLGTPHHNIPKIYDPTMEPESTWDALEHPEKEESLIRKCPFDERIKRLLAENPNYPAPPMPQQMPLSSQIERQAQLQSLTKAQLVEQVVLMQDQQQLLLQQMSQLSSNQGSSYAASSMMSPKSNNSSIKKSENSSIAKSDNSSIAKSDNSSVAKSDNSSVAKNSYKSGKSDNSSVHSDAKQQSSIKASESSSVAPIPEESHKSEVEEVKKEDEEEEYTYEEEEEEEEEVVYEYED